MLNHKNNAMKKKIAIITFHAVSNHGSVLQTLATKKKMEQWGLDVEIINFKKQECTGIFPLIKFWNQDFSNPLKKFVRGVILFPSFLKWKYMFSRFLRKYVDIDVNAKSYTTEEDFKSLPIDADIYCVGSDQVWNSIWNGDILKPLFLSFVPDKLPKVAYSSSFGRTELSDSEKKETASLLKKFDAISVREESGLRILEDLGIHDAVNILDPTLLMNQDFWAQYTPERKIKEDYVLIYQLYSNSEFDKYAEEVAKLRKCKLVRFCTRYDQLLKRGHGYLAPNVEDFLSLIKYANLLITDSFHGTAFACNLNTEFLAYIPKFGGRIYNLLNIVSLQDRAITDFKNIHAADSHIDFVPVNAVLDKERKKGDEYIERMLSVSNAKLEKK